MVSPFRTKCASITSIIFRASIWKSAKVQSAGKPCATTFNSLISRTQFFFSSLHHLHLNLHWHFLDGTSSQQVHLMAYRIIITPSSGLDWEPKRFVIITRWRPFRCNATNRVANDFQAIGKDLHLLGFPFHCQTRETTWNRANHVMTRKTNTFPIETYAVNI